MGCKSDEAGKLEAIAYNGGKEVARTSVETTGPAVALELVPDRSALATVKIPVKAVSPGPYVAAAEAPKAEK